MPVSPARQAAYEVLRRVESGGNYAVELLEGPRYAKLAARDRSLLTEIVMGTLRWQGELDYWIEKLSSKPMKYFDAEISTVLRLSLYQIRFLERVPKAAAVNEAVELAKRARKRSAAGLVNAVLRKSERAAWLGREREGRGGGIQDTEFVAGAQRSLPGWLRERWERNFGSEVTTSLAVAAVQVPHAALRVAVDEREAIREELRREGLEARRGRFAPGALVVERGNVTGSKVVREGRAVIQDEASQLVAGLLAARPGERVLDLCAAPGIKAGQIALAQGGGVLVACDRSARRLHTMAKLLPPNLPGGLTLARVRLDASRELPFGAPFHRVLVDAPCSGTGTLARNPEIKWRLRPGDVARLAELQAGILSQALTAVRPGGRLVYATCSLEPEENEGVVERVLAGQRDFRRLTKQELEGEFPHLAALFDTRGYFRTRPDLHGMDGFFASVVTRAA